MNILTNWTQIPFLDSPAGLTIGSFDGVHLGHQTLLHQLRQRISKEGVLAVLTFSNHPSQFFRPATPLSLICTSEHKLKLLQSYGSDLILFFPFNAELASLTYDSFLTQLKQRLHFSHLILGTGAVFGKNREGDESHIQALASLLHFHVEYLPKVLLDSEPISSGKIRSAIAQGDLAFVEKCLGRPYSILIPAQESNVVHLPDLCLPPDGVYDTSVGTVRIDQRAKKVYFEHSFSASTEILFRGCSGI